MELIIAFLIGLLSSFLGSFISGGFSILVFSLFSLVGYEAIFILGLLRLGLLGSNLGGITIYHRARKIVWKFVPLMTLIGSVGAYFGAQLVINTNTEILERMVGIGMIIGALVLLGKPHLGINSFTPGRLRLVFSYIAYFFVVIWSTSVTVGVGLFNALVQTIGFGMSMIEMKATIKFPALVIGLVALFFYAQAGLIDWPLGIALMLGTVLGGNVGARGSLKLGDKWIKYVFVVSVLVFATKLLLGL